VTMPDGLKGRFLSSAELTRELLAAGG
jgi:hypothetical protein